MNRRNFLKTTVVGGISLPFVGTLFGKEPSELDDLYSYLESQQIITPFGLKPFKLYPHQKEILKHIHENDRLIIVKGRQIGMSTMLAGYTSWLSHKRNIRHWYIGPNKTMDNYWTKQLLSMNPCLPSNFSNSTYKISIFDELNFRDYYYIRPTLELCMETSIFEDKIIVTGIVDSQDILINVICKYEPKGYKVLYYPVTKCFPMWTKEKINDICIWADKTKLNRELFCIS